MPARSHSLHFTRRLICRVSLVLALAWSTACVGASSPWFSRVWQSDEGLPDNTVVGVEQTQDGFLWAATQGGLVRFDGLRFVQFTPVSTAGAPTSLMQALLVDHSGRLWCAKERGTVVRVDNGRTKAFTTDDGLPQLEARLMVEDGQGGVWISYIGGDEVVRIRNDQVHLFSRSDGLPSGGTCQLATDRDGRLWFAQGSSLGVFRNGQFVAIEHSACQRIASARSGGLWYCTGRHLFKYTEGKAPVKLGDLPSNHPSIEPNPTVLYEDRSGRLWIGTRETGLFVYDGTTFDAVSTSHQEILCVHEDREGNLWVGTRGGGLNEIKPRIVELLAMDPRIPFEAARSACQDLQGVIWAVSQNGEVWRRDRGEWSSLGASDGWTLPYAQCVATSTRGGIWIGTQYKGLYRWQDGKITNSFLKGEGLAWDNVSALQTTPQNAVWVGTSSPDGQQHAVQWWQGGQFKTFELPASSGPVSAFSPLPNGDCWVATAGGLLLRAGPKGMIDETKKTLAIPYAIRSLCTLPDGSLWIAYAGEGVGRLKGGKFSQFGSDQGLYDDYISQIVFDDRSRMWFAGNRGIFYVSENEFGAVTEGRASRLCSVAFGQNDGLPRLQANHDYWPGALRSRDGELWFPMQSGLAVVKADKYQENPSPPPVFIDRVVVNGITLASYGPNETGASSDDSCPLDLSRSHSKLRLLPGPKQAEFVFTALSFNHPEAIGFRHRLKGFDSDWVDDGLRRSVTYPVLPPGDYEFQVSACNREGVWSQTGAELPILAEPFWWQTGFFLVTAPLLAVVGLGGGIVFAVRRSHRRQIERLELLEATERERTRIAQDLHDDLGAGLTQISLNTAMVQNPAVAPEIASGMLLEIDQRARELVTVLDEIVWAVNPKNDTVPSLARYLCQFTQGCLAPTEIACRLQVVPVLPDIPIGAEQRHHLFLAFKEALNNALRHSGADELRLEIAIDQRALLVILTDNGRGFLHGPVLEGADGLGNMQSRMERLGGRCEVTSAPGRGTQVLFKLPLSPANGS